MVVAAGWVGVGLGPAGAHAFLVRTDPPQGARLDGLPRYVSLEFSEPVTEPGAQIAVRTADGGQPSPLRLEWLDGGRTMRAALSADRRGIVLVGWEVVADDGHRTAGEFAFAVGPVPGSIPSGRSNPAPPDPIRTAAGWLFFAGLSIASGALALSCVEGDRGGRRATTRVGLLVATAAAVLAWTAAGAGFDGGGTRQELLLAASGSAAAVGTLTARWVQARWPTLAALAVTAAAWSGHGQPAVSNGVLAWILDVVHLLTGATWVGAICLVALRLWRAGRTAGREAVLAATRRYARVALVLVAVLAAAGVTAAFMMLNEVAELWTTRYGQLLLAKSVLFATALLLATVARTKGLRRAAWSTLRRVTPLEAAALVAVLVVTGVLTNTAPPAPATPAASLLGPPPMTGLVARAAGQVGILTVAVAAGDGQLQVEVLPPGGDARGATAAVEARLPDGTGVTLEPRPCGHGCWSQAFELPAGRTELAMTAAAPDWPGGTFTTAVDWPPPPEDPSLLNALVATMRAVPSVELTEQVTSGPDSAGAPATFEVSGAEFVASEPYGAGTADDVHGLGGGERGFRLYVSGDRIWVTVWLDDQGRLAREQIVNLGHVIDRTFRYP